MNDQMDCDYPFFFGLKVFMHMLAYDRACLHDTHVHIVKS